MPKRLNLEDCHKIAIEKNGKCLSTEYIDNKTKMRWQCGTCENTWESKFSHIKSGHWCPACGGSKNLTIEDCRKIAKLNEGECLSTEYINNRSPIEFKCKHNHVFTALMCNVARKTDPTWCSTCSGKKPYTIEDCHKEAEKRGGKCLSDEYTNCKAIYTWQCDKKHQPWRTSFDHIKNEHTWCPTCLQIGYSKMAMNWLKTLPDYKNIQHAESKGGEHKLFKRSREKADGYNKETNTVYEFNGCYYHGCPKCYPETRNTILRTKKTREQAYQDTLKKEQKIKDEGYNLVVKWECEL